MTSMCMGPIQHADAEPKVADAEPEVAVTSSMVIDNICKVIGRESIRLHQNLVINISPGCCDPSFYSIFVNTFACKWNFQSYDKGLSFCFSALNFFGA